MTLRLCVICGEPTPESRCGEHQLPEREGKASARARGYDSAWDRLSKRARQIQPWCTVCGTKDDLTTDHLRWPARTLADVDVLCRSHNATKGQPDESRVRKPRGIGSDDDRKDPRGKANGLTVPLGGMQ